ncbi:MAG: lipopolysaccharide kinase InaA family protein [Desulfobacterota bacterium]|nr:lipopolysaccharide kinase InaA family protein [Thermodesulfobacteriota bacterium]
MTQIIRHDDIIWKVREGAAWLVDTDGPVEQFRRGKTDNAVSVVRDNFIRTSVLLSTGRSDCPEVFVKRYKRGGIRDAVKYLLLPSKAAREWRMLCAGEQRGIPSPRPLAYAERRVFGILRDSFLVAQSVAPAAPLHEYLLHYQPTRFERRRLAASLGRLVATLHRERLYYRDLHAGNILVRTAGPAAGALLCVDLHRALFLPLLPHWMAVADLAQLCSSVSASQRERLLFLQTYCAVRFGSTAMWTEFSRCIVHRQQALERRRIRSRSKRCMKNSTVFEKRCGLFESYFGRRDFGYAAACCMIREHWREEARVVKQASKSRLTLHEVSGGDPVCVKGYRSAGLQYGLKQLVCPTRARKSWRAAHGLLVRGFDTPQPLALVEKRIGPYVRETYFITRWISAAQELNEYVLAEGFGDHKAAFIASLATTIRRLHEQGIYHADLKSNNILVVPDREHGWRFYFVDLDRVSFDRRLSFRKRARTLAQINASVAASITVRDRLQFFRIYAKETALWPQRKKYYRRILAITRRKNTAPYGLHCS